MNKSLLLFFIIVLSVPVLTNAKMRSEFIPQINSPLQDTKGTHNFSLGAACEKRRHYDTLSLRFSANYSFAVTDKIAFNSLPWPIIQMQVKSADSRAYIKDGIWKATALSLCIGAKGTAPRTHFRIRPYHYYYNDHFRIFPQIELLSKMRLRNNVWAQFDMHLSSVSNEAIQGYMYPRAGYQLTNHIYGMIGCRAGFFSFSDDVPEYSRITYFYRYGYSLDFFNSSNSNLPYIRPSTLSITMPVEIGFDPGKHFSVVISTSIGKKVSKFIPLQLRCNLEW